MAPLRALLSLAALPFAAGLSQHPVHRSSRQSQLVATPPLWTGCSDAQNGFEPVTDQCLDANLILIRVFKCGTSSLSSVLLRVAARHGLHGIDQKTAEGLKEPIVSISHFPRPTWSEEPFVKKMGEFGKLNIMMSMVRDPEERWLSDFYYRATKGKEENDVVKFLKDVPFKEKNFDFELNYVRHKNGTTVAEVLHDYPLVGIQERFDDTVTALMYMLGINSYCDVLYVDAKVSKGKGESRSGDTWLTHIPLRDQPAEVQDLMASEDFQRLIAGDKELWAAANKRMDATIEKIGEERFSQRRAELRRWLSEAQSECDDGERFGGDCYREDLGCKHKCLDNFCKVRDGALSVPDPAAPMFNGDHIFMGPHFQTSEQ